MENKATARETCTSVVDRVRDHTAEEINAQIDRETETRLYGYASRSKEEISRRIEELEREWDMERLLETNASTLALFGLAMAAAHSEKWLILPGVVFSFLMQHAVQGWCPPVPVFRRLGVRTRQEIGREKYALKVLRGNFEKSPGETGKSPSPEAVMGAVGA
jgi:hypothetical protein